MLLYKPYDRTRAVEYARRWARSRSPLFINFTGYGGDCTSFVSQCVLAGSCEMNFTPTFGWYYVSPTDRAPAWSGVEAFYDFMTGAPAFASENGGVGPYGREVGREEVRPGDVVQLADAEGDFYHTLLVTEIRGGEILVAAHSDDALDRRLSTYVNAASRRFIHIEAVRVEVADDTCYFDLLEGISLSGRGVTPPTERAPEAED